MLLSSKDRPFDSWDALKLLALFLMFIDHSGHFFFADDKWLRAIGRSAAPIFLFLGGFAASYRFKWDLFMLAVLMSVSDFLITGHLHSQNILFTILGCRMIFAWLERHGRKIERPYEWYIGCVAMIITIFFVQYGSYGLLFAICGYMQRRGQDYSQKLQRNFRLLTFVTYAVISGTLFQFSLFDNVLMVAVLIAVYGLLSQLEIREIKTARWPSWLLRAGKWASFYSGYIYAFHLIALEWLTGVPF